jgi:hypothetical protein
MGMHGYILSGSLSRAFREADSKTNTAGEAAFRELKKILADPGRNFRMQHAP